MTTEHEQLRGMDAMSDYDSWKTSPPEEDPRIERVEGAVDAAFKDCSLCVQMEPVLADSDGDDMTVEMRFRIVVPITEATAIEDVVSALERLCGSVRHRNGL